MPTENNGLTKTVNRDRRWVVKEQIIICEECMGIFSFEEIKPDGKWGHICKEKKFRKEVRCESYLETYTKERKSL